MENGNGILKTRGWLTPVVAMAAAPVADMATVTAAHHERISANFCVRDLAEILTPTTAHHSPPSDDDVIRTR